jgi:hypothetical protein
MYFFGNKPTSLDAVVFAYLHIILSLLSESPSESRLRKMTLQHDNLAQYSKRIWTEWYAKVDSIANRLRQ